MEGLGLFAFPTRINPCVVDAHDQAVVSDQN